MSSSATHFDSVATTTNGRRPIFANLFNEGSFLKRTVLFLSALALAFFSFDASATTYFSAVTGNWSAAASWATVEGGAGGAGVPTSSDIAIIRGGNTITVDVTNAVCATLQLGGLSGGGGSGTIAFNASTLLTVSGDITLGGGSASRTGSINMTNGGTLRYSGALTTPNFGTFTAGTGTIDCNGAAQTVSTGLGAYNNLTLSGSGSVTTTGVTVNGTLSLQGTATVANAITYGASAILEYKGSAAQTTSSNEFLATMAKVVINNANGVTLNGSKTISGTLTLTNGDLNVGNNTLTISSSATTAITSSSTNYIVLGATSGRLAYTTMTQNSVYTFPVGNSSYYLPVTVQPTTAAGNFSVGVFQGITMNGQPGGTPYDANAKKKMVDAVWDIARVSGTATANISVQWDPALEGSLINGLSGAAIGISHYVSGWQLPQSSASNTTTKAFATYSSFSPFGVASSSTPLATKLQYFTGSVVSGNAVLQWGMGNNDTRQINVEKSTDGQSFGTLAQIAINSSNVYEYKDAMGAGANNYYRLKMVATDGVVTYSNIVNLKTNKFGSTPITISPNPAKDAISVVYPLTSSEASLNIVDMQGRVVFKQIVSANTDQGDLNISALPAGIYLLRMDAGNSQVQQLFYHQ